MTDLPQVGTVWVDSCWPDLPEGSRRLAEIVGTGPTITYRAWTDRNGERRDETAGRISLDLFHLYYTPAQENL